MSSKTERTPDRREAGGSPPPPPWLNTKPRGNPDWDRRDLARSIERFEMVLGR